jgi:hypothetical protein
MVPESRACLTSTLSDHPHRPTRHFAGALAPEVWTGDPVRSPAQGSGGSIGPRKLSLAASDANPKIDGEPAGGSTRRSAAEPGPSRWMGARSGGGFEGDHVAEGFELADVVALAALGVDPGVVEARAEVLVVDGGVGQQVPDDDQDGAADRDDGPLGAAASGDAPVAFPRKVVVRPAATAASPSTRARYGLPCPVVALPLRLPADSLTPGANFAQEARWPGWGSGPCRCRSRR